MVTARVSGLSPEVMASGLSPQGLRPVLVVCSHFATVTRHVITMADCSCANVSRKISGNATNAPENRTRRFYEKNACTI